MRAFGMAPVLPAFNGHVPASIQDRFPNAAVVATAGWEGFDPTFFLDPSTPLYHTLQSKYIEVVAREYGTDHLYSLDPCVENVTYNSLPPHCCCTDTMR